MSTHLLERWLTALRASEVLAVGRECDYGRMPDEADTFDVIGLLALAVADHPEEALEPDVYGFTSTGWRFYRTSGSDSEGCYYTRQYAVALATRVGLTEADLTELVRLNDAGYNGIFLALWIENSVRGAHTEVE